jgi:hypothetical protein
MSPVPTFYQLFREGVLMADRTRTGRTFLMGLILFTPTDGHSWFQTSKHTI